MSRQHLIVGLLASLLVFNIWRLTRTPPSPIDLDRRRIVFAADRIGEALRDYEAVLGRQDRSPPHGSPVKGPISSPYGMRLHPRYKKWMPHHGVDLAVPVGTAVMVTADGWVSRVDEDPGGWGVFVEVVHPTSGLLTRYAHLSSVRCRVGQPVRRGRIIALSGASGNAAGAHLHYEIRTRQGDSVDPLRLPGS